MTGRWQQCCPSVKILLCLFSTGHSQTKTCRLRPQSNRGLALIDQLGLPSTNEESLSCSFKISGLDKIPFSKQTLTQAQLARSHYGFKSLLCNSDLLPDTEDLASWLEHRIHKKRINACKCTVHRLLTKGKFCHQYRPTGALQWCDLYQREINYPPNMSHDLAQYIGVVGK